jgi:alanine racemase
LTQPSFVLDLDAVAYNVACWARHLDGREIWSVVKSDAYGCGAADVGKACLKAGATRLVVFDVEEARPLRAARIDAPIVHVFPTRGDDLATAVQLGVVPTIEDEAGARELAAIGEWRMRRIAAHVAIDTGTGWSGVPALRAEEFARAVRGLTGITWEGAWTHIAGKESMDAQLRSFAVAVAAMRAQGLAIPIVHATSTGPTLWGRATGPARIGIGLYGSSMGEAGVLPGLRTAVTVEARVIAVKRFDVATPLGYGGLDVAQPEERIVTLRIGYADGLPKSLSSGGGVAAIGDVLCPIAGAIGMNLTMARLPAGTDARIGDVAVLLGDREGVRIDDVAAAAQTIPHALLTSLANGIGVRSKGAP